jgi:hypothetical protein
MDFLGKWTECDICGEPFKIVLNSEICLKCGQVRLNGKTITSALKTVDAYKSENETQISEYSKLLCMQQLDSLSPEEQELVKFLNDLNTIVGIISEEGVYTTKLKEPQKLYDLLLKLDSFAKKNSNQDK